jgi:hypothetical protein
MARVTPVKIDVAVESESLRKLIADANEAREQLKVATREAHEAAQFLALTIKEAKQLTDPYSISTVVDATIGAAIVHGLSEYKSSLARAVDEATKAVYKRFDYLTDLLLGADAVSKRKGSRSLEDIGHEIAERIKRGGVDS